MPTESYRITSCACHCQEGLFMSDAEVAATTLAERMLDAAEGAGLDLWELERRRRQLVRDMAEYDAVTDEFGVVEARARNLRHSIELGVGVLAEAFVYLRSVVEQELPHVRP